ncbi:30S ribosomal protein S6e [Methanopyrus sp. KOL6]|uniref:30S ribosomal protein S6e n=1 Tax=Methanopyrus sp. KOL6 TaxID=1937004 RepID=UPI000B4B8476|nr:30S ribosomal protein S6e [Methanopyrus sp. KOL6]
MPEFKVVVADPEKARSYQVDVKGEDAEKLIGKRIGDVIDGEIVGLPGYKLKITGGTDKDGFPMRPDIHGPVRVRPLLSGPPGFRPERKGERRRKTVRGNTISEDIVQVNTVIVKYGDKPVEELLGEGGEEE